MQFALEGAKVRLVAKTEKTEKVGGSDVLCCDLSFEYDATNEVLAAFHPDLRSMLYRRDEDPQAEITPDPAHLTVLRCPLLEPVKVRGSQSKCALAFSRGKKIHVQFAEASVSHVKLDCQDGGDVCVHFKTRVHPDEVQSGKLSGLLTDKYCLLTLSPSEEVGGQPPLDV